MADYPDGTYPVDIVRQDLASLSVDIVAQTIAQVAVDIAAQTLSALKINITAQDLAQLVINISAQTIGVQIYREWASTTGNQKTASGSGAIAGGGAAALVTYEVPAGRVLYISGFSGGGTQVGHVSLIVSGMPTLTAYFLASQSVPRTLGVPQKVTAGVVVYVTVYNDSVNIGTFAGDFEGWEETA